MENNLEALPENFSELEQLTRILLQTNRSHEQEIAYLKEQVFLLRARLYGKQSESYRTESGAEQLRMFDHEEDAEAEGEKDIEEDSTTVETHQRKKRGRKPLPADLPRKEILHDIAEDEKICGCGSSLSRIGEDTQEQLDYIPAKMQVLRHIRPKYACKVCEGIDSDGPTVKIAPPPKQIIPKSMAAPSLLAHVMTAKFVDALPFYRQEKQFLRLGITLARATMCGWLILTAVACSRLLELLRQEVHAGPLINIDETTLQVLKEVGRSPSSTSYMWFMRGGLPESPAFYFEYHPTREGDVARKMLEGYQGLVQSDGYVCYDFLDHEDRIKHAGCWAHARRKFIDALKGLGNRSKNKKTTQTEVALGFIRQLYAIERLAKKEELSDSQLLEKRQKEAKPLLEKFKKWLLEKADQVPPKTLLGQAISYTLGQWHRLVIYLDYACLTPDNNLAENAVRPFVIGRKNWLFHDSPRGAEAGAAIYSLIETAKANGWEPNLYLRLLFEKLPYAQNDQQLKNLLPQYLEHGK